MRLWVDDLRPSPEGYLWVKSVNEAKEFIADVEEDLKQLYSQLNTQYSHHEERQKLYTDRIQKEIDFMTISLIDIYHDAGEYSADGGDYIRLLDWLEMTGRNYPIRIHSMNPVGVENMRNIIRHNNWKEVY